MAGNWRVVVRFKEEHEDWNAQRESQLEEMIVEQLIVVVQRAWWQLKQPDYRDPHELRRNSRLIFFYLNHLDRYA